MSIHQEVAVTGKLQRHHSSLWPLKFGDLTTPGAQVYELHVAEAQRKGGVATALLELVERSARGRSAPTVELNVHRENESARGFYEHVGFAQVRELSGGRVLVMQRKR